VKGERPRRQKRYFTAEEVEYLYEGIARFGLGNWSQILRNFNFTHRTSVDLKDKWRNIIKRNPEEAEAKVREIQMRLNIVDTEDVTIESAVAVDALPVVSLYLKYCCLVAEGYSCHQMELCHTRQSIHFKTIHQRQNKH
jgi:hypothetical protein